MKILVTGGTGFTGKALVRRLLDAGHQVVALDYKEGLKTNEFRDWGPILRDTVPALSITRSTILPT
jgi:nucleoside-diphosphate-sugar epimerase